MPLPIEDDLRRLSQANGDVGLLWAQWEYDRRLFTRALSTIGQVFPHYSLHDESHSRAILERIASVLGPSTQNLSASDLWFLLEAAYLHDVGMIAIDATKREDLRSQAFADHLRETAEGPPGDLGEAARRIQSGGLISSPLEILDRNIDLLFVYAEYVRPRHAQRASTAVREPLSKLAVASPSALTVG